jgi:hypothetical protein
MDTTRVGRRDFLLDPSRARPILVCKHAGCGIAADRRASEMKIGLNIGGNEPRSDKAAEGRAFERTILAAKKGDWEAKQMLIRKFLPFITSLAEKRATDPIEINKLVDAGKQGLITAAGKYKTSVGHDRFQIFALDFIEANMNRSGKPPGFLSRLFGNK